MSASVEGTVGRIQSGRAELRGVDRLEVVWDVRADASGEQDRHEDTVRPVDNAVAHWFKSVVQRAVKLGDLAVGQAHDFHFGGRLRKLRVLDVPEERFEFVSETFAHDPSVGGDAK